MASRVSIGAGFVAGGGADMAGGPSAGRSRSGAAKRYPTPCTVPTIACALASSASAARMPRMAEVSTSSVTWGGQFAASSSSFGTARRFSVTSWTRTLNGLGGSFTGRPSRRSACLSTSRM